MRKFESSELIINEDGSIFHLHLFPDQLADLVILVGDPARVDRVASHFDTTEFRVANREFVTITGSYRGRRMSVLSTGIGTDNIDIVVNELDALANIDFITRTEHPIKRSLTLVRLGTSGALQPDIQLGELILSRTSIGFDGLLNFYAGGAELSNQAMEHAFMTHTAWSPRLSTPYFVDSSEELAALFTGEAREGITISAPGFYAPQGRSLRLGLADPQLNERIESFNYQGRVITNFEMESSALAGLSTLLGHRSTTICTIIAQRVAHDMQTDYRPFVERMIQLCLDKLAEM